MDFGIFPLMQQRYRSKSPLDVVQEAVEQTRVAEQCGFANAWFAEHHFSNYSLCPSPLMMAAHCAGVTTRIRVGAAVVIAPLYAPPRLIAEIGFVDSLSNGRLELGIGSGYQQFEFERFGIDLNDRKEMTTEVLDMIELAFRDTTFTYAGKHFCQPPTVVSARPVQQPHPPIWIVSSDPELMRRSARNGYNIFITGVLGDARRLENLRNGINEAAALEGKAPSDIKVGLLRFGFASDNRAEVEKYVECARYQQRLGQGLKQRRANVVDSYMVDETPLPAEPPLSDMQAILPVGDVDTCIERMIRDIQACGAGHVAIQTQVGDMDPKAMLRSIELWGTRIIPAIQKELGVSFGLPGSAAAASNSAKTPNEVVT